MRLVGIAGRAGAGKSMVAYRLAQLSDYRVMAFATPLKRMAVNFLVDNYGYDQSHAELYLAHKTIKIPELGVTMRHLLQTLGTDWGRQLIDPYLWTNIAADEIAEHMEWTDVVVDDVRFESEASLIRDFGGLVIHLVRPGGVIDHHASEAGIAIKPDDVIITNNGSEIEVMEQVIRAIDHFHSNTARLLELCHTPCWRYQP